MDSYEDQEDFNDFIVEVNYIFKEISINADRKIDTEQQTIPLGFPLDNFLTAKLINPDMNIDICPTCQLITRIKNTFYYQRNNGDRLVEFKLPDAKSNIIIYEKNESELKPEEMPEGFSEDYAEELSEGIEDDDDVDVVFLSLILITSLFLGFAIYWPIKNLQKQIKTLIDTHHQFGSGNLTAKADEDIQKPLDELAHSFNDMAQAIAIADNVKERDTFSQAIPHEVRTPLSRIQLASGLIRRKSTDLDILALVDDVDNYVVDINELIGQIVEYSKINSTIIAGSLSSSNLDNESEEDQFQTIEVKSFFKSRLDILAKNQHKSFTLTVDESVEMTTNPFYLRLLVDNFIKNAFNHAQDKIQLSAKIEQNQLSIVIEDDGVGVPVDDRETIFIAFARLDKSRSRKTGGLGLGLPIAKAAATKMAGKIMVSESSLGGAMFSFTKNI